MTFEEELRALRALNAGLKPVPRQHRARLIRQVQDALNREEQHLPRLSPVRALRDIVLPGVQDGELAPPPDAA